MLTDGTHDISKSQTLQLELDITRWERRELVWEMKKQQNYISEGNVKCINSYRALQQEN